MGDYKKCGSTVIEGKKRTLYSKTGSTKKYVQRKGRMMNVIKYKKMLEKKAAKAAKAAAPKRVKKTRKTPKRRGGEGDANNLVNDMMKNISMM
jgi:hypothetical protein